MVKRVAKRRGARPRGSRIAVVERLEPRQLLTVAPNTSTSELLLLTDDVRHAATAQAMTPAAATVGSSGDPRIESVRSGYKWGTTNLTYSFYTGGTYYGGSEASPSPVSDAVKANVRFILSQIISPATNLTFTEVADTPSSYGMLRYLCSTSPNYAYAYLPTGGDTNTGGSSDVVGDVVLRTSFDVAGSDGNSFRNGPGSHGFLALIHETGHALGLKHTFESPAALSTADDNQDNSVMTYTFAGSSPATLMPYDILALQYFYGANTSTRSGDTTYTFTAPDVFSPGGGSAGAPISPFSTMRNTLWDAGGSDTINLSGLPAAASGYRVDVQPGGWITSTASYNSVTYSGSYRTTNLGTRLALAGTTIENVIVSGSSDTIFVNAAANRISGYTPGRPTGADTITGANQGDTLDLSNFLESGVTKSQVGNDLVLNLGGSTGTVTVKDYFVAASGSRINIVYATAPTITIAATDSNKGEGTGSGATPFTFTVTRSGGLSAASTVAWAVAGSGVNAATAADFAGGVLPAGAVTFVAGEATKTITVNVAADTVIEADEEFTVTLSAPTGATLGAPSFASGTIRNDDLPVFAIAVAAADSAEGTGGTPTALAFTISRQPAVAGPSSVAWAVTGSGVNPADASDFAGGVLPSGSVSFAAGETSRTITVSVSADAVIEFDETFAVTLSAPIGATLGAALSAVGTIRNDDFPAVTIAAVAADTVEGTGSGSTAFTFTINRQSGFAGESTVAWAVAGSGANPANAADFAGGVLPSGSVSFAAGETTKTITVSVAADAIAEFDETFAVRLSSSTNAAIGPASSAVGTIRNDDYRSFFSVAAAEAVKNEGDSGRTPLTFTITRTGSLVGDVSVPWAVTGSGTNRADRFDFIGGVLPSGTFRIAAGRQTATITVNVLCDRVAEFDEQFTVTLATPLGGLDAVATGGAAAFGRILNDDAGTPRLAAAIAAQAFAAFAEQTNGTGAGTTKRASRS